MRPMLQRIVTNKVLFVTLGLLALYALVGFTLAPSLVERYVSNLIEKRLDRTVTMGELRVNPFLLTLEINQFAVEGAYGQPVLAAEQLFVDLSASGIVNRAWTFDRLAIDRLRVHAVVERNGGMNLADLARQWSRGSTGNSDAGQRIIFQDLLLQNGRIYVTDLSDEQPVKTEIGPIRLEASDVATFSDGDGNFELAAKLPEGGALAWRGVVSLDPLSSTGSFAIAKLRAAALWPFFRDELQLATLQGAAQLSANYAFQAEGKPMLVADQIAIELSQLLIARPDQEPMLKLERVAGSGGRFSSADWSLVMPNVDARNGVVRLQVGSDGALNWQQIVDADGGAQASAGERRRWRVQIEALNVAQIGLHYEDRSRAQPLQAGIAEIEGSAKVALTGGDAARIVVSDGDLDLRRITLEGASEEPVLSLGSAQIANARLDSAAKRIEARALNIKGGNAAIVREPDGDIAPFDRLPFARADSGAPSAKPAGERGDSWAVRIAAASAEDIALHLADQTFDPPVSYNVVLQSAAIKDLATDAKSAMPFEASLAVEQGGQLSARGTIALDALAVNAKLDIDALALPPLQPLVQRFAALKLESGVLSTQTDVSYRADGNRFQVSGGITVSDLLLNEAGWGDRFLAWKQLTARGLEWRSGVARVSVDEVIATGPQAKIVISKDRQVNLAQIWRRQSGQPAGQTANAEPRRAGSKDDPLQVQVSQVRVRGGVIDFTDHSLVLPFSTRITGVNGAIVGISSDLSRHAEVSAQGEVQPYGSASVKGMIEVFEPTRHMNLDVTFNNVAMPQLSPYTATLAGRKIESGRLWLDLDYEIEKGELLGKNGIRIENFVLGERVKAPNALDLPLDLMIALLKDSSGTIRMSVPVEGNLNQPRFSFAGAIRSALGDLVQRIVTAPFRALAQMFGLKDEQSLADINFVPGSARLRPEARERLDVLARALRERPQLQLIVTGQYDEQTDTQALRRQRAQRDLVVALGRTITAGEDPGPIDYRDAPAQRQIEAMLARQAGRDAVESLKQNHAADGRALYQAMFERLVDSYPVHEAAAQILAAQRADTIARHLASASDVDADRIRTGHLREVDPREQNLISAELRVAAGDASAPVIGSAEAAPTQAVARQDAGAPRTE